LLNNLKNYSFNKKTTCNICAVTSVVEDISTTQRPGSGTRELQVALKDHCSATGEVGFGRKN
jgi:hypothetical protein